MRGLRETYHRLRNYFGRTRWYSLVMVLECKLVSVHLEIVLIFMQDRCTVAPNVPWAQKSFWRNPMVVLGDEAQVEAHLGLFGDSVTLDAR